MISEKKGTRYSSKERVKLETVIPLPAPMILFVDPSSICNLACKFCPCGNANKELWGESKKTSQMSYELFRKIIDDSKGFGRKFKVLRLYKEGEPLINKRLPDMIRYAKMHEIAESIDFTTNGTLLTRDLNLALIDAGVDRINISVEALDEEGYYRVSGVRIPFNNFMEILSHLYQNRGKCHIFIKTTDYMVKNEEEEKRFYHLFEPVCDEIDIEHITSVWPEYEIGIEKPVSIYGQGIQNLEVCPYIFYSICINSDGSVSSCLMDWNHKSIVGDVKQESIVNIWNNTYMMKMRVENLKGNRKNLGICSNCGQLKYAAIDNIDAYKEILLQRFYGQNP